MLLVWCLRAVLRLQPSLLQLQLLLLVLLRCGS